MVGDIHQEIDGRFEHVRNFGRVGFGLEIGGQNPHDRRDAKHGAGDIGRAATQNLHLCRVHADFFLSLAQGGGDFVHVDRIDLAARKGNLSGMIGHRVRAQGEQRGRTGFARDDTKQHRRRADYRQFFWRQEVEVAIFGQPPFAMGRVKPV